MMIDGYSLRNQWPRAHPKGGMKTCYNIRGYLQDCNQFRIPSITMSKRYPTKRNFNQSFWLRLCFLRNRPISSSFQSSYSIAPVFEATTESCVVLAPRALWRLEVQDNHWIKVETTSRPWSPSISQWRRAWNLLLNSYTMIRMGNSNLEERCAFLLRNSGTQSLLCQLKQCQHSHRNLGIWMRTSTQIHPRIVQKCTISWRPSLNWKTLNLCHRVSNNRVSKITFQLAVSKGLFWFDMFFSGVSKEFQPVSCAEDIRLHHQRDALSSALAGHLVRHRWKFTSKTYANSLG